MHLLLLTSALSNFHFNVHCVGTVVANGTYPGPPILAEKGDTLVVTVNNKLVGDLSFAFLVQQLIGL